MKKLSIILLLCVLVLFGLVAVYGNGKQPQQSQESAIAPESESGSSSEPTSADPVTISSESFTYSLSEPELPSTSSAEAPKPSSPPSDDAPLIVRVVDESGNPVENVSGMLQLGLGTENSSPPSVGLVGSGGSQNRTDSDGKLYFTDSAELLPARGVLVLHALYDFHINQATELDFPTAQREITITWTGGTPPSAPPDPADRRITFHIVDENGQPVPCVSGYLSQAAGASASMRALSGDPDHYSGDTGALYLELETNWEQQESSRSYLLTLYAYFDEALRQETTIELSDPPASYTIIWTQAAPPAERPGQTTGIQIYMVDPEGNPVSGVELSGSPYPKETTGAVPDIAILLGPSDAQGYIRWDDVKPGTYELYGNKDGESQRFEFIMPLGQAIETVTLVWNPQMTEGD